MTSPRIVIEHIKDYVQTDGELQQAVDIEDDDSIETIVQEPILSSP